MVAGDGDSVRQSDHDDLNRRTTESRDAGSFVSGQDLVVDGVVVAGSRWSQLLKTRAAMAEEMKGRAS